MRNSPFADLSKSRFFVLRGGSDYANWFYLYNGDRVDIETFLSYHLREKCGDMGGVFYDRVVVHDGFNICAVDEQSSESLKAFFGTRNKKSSETPGRSSYAQMQFSRSAESGNDDKALYKQPVKDWAAALNAFDRLMNDTEQSTAIIIRNAALLFSDVNNREERVDRQFSNYVLSWSRLDHNYNSNILIFLFENTDAMTYGALVDNHTTMGSMRGYWGWKKEGETSVNTGHEYNIGAPSQDEFINMLTSLRLRFGEGVIDAGIISDAAQALMNIDEKYSSNIERVYTELFNRAKSGERITKEWLVDELKCSWKGDAIAQLDRPGWESAKEQVLGVIDIIEDADETKKADIRKERTTDLERLMKNAVELDTKPHHGIYNIALSGPPGTGKTTIARIIYEVLIDRGILNGGSFRTVSVPDIQSKYVGHTAEKVQEIILGGIGGVTVLNEAYALSPTRNGLSAHNYGNEAIDVMVDLLERYKGQGVFILTGYEKEMDEFLKSNPGFGGRFPHRITIDGYDSNALDRITRYIIKKEGYTLSPGLERKWAGFIVNWYNARDKENFGNARDCEKLIDAIKVKTHRAGRTEIREEDLKDVTLNGRQRIVDFLP